MKRVLTTLTIVFSVILLALIILIFRPVNNSNAPQFIPVQIPRAGPFIYEEYDWNGSVPIRDNKFWLWARGPGTNRQNLFFLYDLNQGRIIGQFSNAAPVFGNHDLTKFLCEGFGPPVPSLKSRFGTFVNRLSAGRFNLFPSNRIEGFWTLDLRNNSALKLGELSQFPGYGSRWLPAPDFRFAVNTPSTSSSGLGFYLCDLDENALSKISFVGTIRGWWDNHTLVATNSAKDYILFDVVSRKTAPLFTIADISQFLKDRGIGNYPADYAPVFNWNGAQYDMYLTANRRNGLDTNATFLIKAQHEGPRFKLVSRNFQLHWLGHLDASATHYLYGGESGPPGKGGDGSVWLRDLSDNSERLLVPPDNAGQYALARMYSNTVIYWRNRVLWRVDFNTTNSFRLFPPAAN